MRSKGFEDEVVDLFSWAGYISLGFFVLTFLAVITKDIIYIIIGLLSKAAATINHSPEPIDPDRRDFIEKILSISIVTTTGLSTINGLYNARKGSTIMKSTVPIKGLDDELNGLTIAQISDLHVGPTIKKDM